jgi:tRNA(adenine34) deaminase
MNSLKGPRLQTAIMVNRLRSRRRFPRFRSEIKKVLIKAKKKESVQAMTLPHEHFMHLAIDQAIVAGQMGEVPVGAVIVDADGQVLAQDHNRTITICDPSAHAEINVLRSAARRIKNYRLLSTTLYVSIEPCAMCMGAIVHARVKTVVFGAPDPKWGAAGSLYHLGHDSRLNHQVEIVQGVCADRCRFVIQAFFRERRKAQ